MFLLLVSSTSTSTSTSASTPAEGEIGIRVEVEVEVEVEHGQPGMCVLSCNFCIWAMVVLFVSGAGRAYTRYVRIDICHRYGILHVLMSFLPLHRLPNQSVLSPEGKGYPLLS